VTEFLPVSSTGHLIIAEQWLPHQSEVFNIIIQCGAVLAVIVIFKERIGQWLFQWRDKATQDYLAKLFIAFVITGLGGVVLKKFGFKLTDKAFPVAMATLVGGILFLVAERWLRGKNRDANITWPIAIAAGLAQLVAAIFPGTSRSGITILIALMMGLNRSAAAEFSFLLGVPTLLAAGALQLFSALRSAQGVPESWDLVLLASVVSAVTAFAVVKWLLGFIQTHTFEGFGWYRIVLGILILVWV
jgi:undecaprenyl-diphosphatase